MATKLLLYKKGGAFYPADPWAAEALDGMTNDEIVTASITRTRNIKFHRKFFAFLNLIFENQTKYMELGDLLDAMKEAVGWGTYIDRADGRGSFFKPKSISFAKMDEDAFKKFYESFVRIVVTHIIPGIEQEDLLREVEAHLV